MASREPQARQSILLVDDDDGVRALLDEVFTAAGFTALTAASGEEALEVAVSARPALVVLDVSLPGLLGLRGLPPASRDATARRRRSCSSRASEPSRSTTSRAC